MEQSQIEEKLNLEGEINTLKREKKHLISETSTAKREYLAIVDLIDTKKKQLEEDKKYHAVVIEEISNAKLSWATEKNSELSKLAEKNSEADNVLKRKAELNLQEEEIRQLVQKDTDVLNEARRLELKVDADKLDLENRERHFEGRKAEFKTKMGEFEDYKKDFKQKVKDLLGLILNI